MLSAYLYNQTRNELAVLDAARVLETMPNADEAALAAKEAANGSFGRTQPHCREHELLWIDITAPDADDFKLLMQRFDLHPMIIEDMKSHEGRPKLHDYGDYLYIIFHALRFEVSFEDEATAKDKKTKKADEETPHRDRYGNRYDLVLDEIDCLIGSDYVITVHAEPIQPLKDLRRRWEQRPNLMRSGTSYLLYEIMDEILDDYFPLLDALEERIDEIEDRLFLEFQEGLSADIFSLKRCLVQIRRIAGPTRDVVNVLLRRDADAGGKHFVYFQDLYDHIVRIVDMADTFRDLLSGALDAYLAMASNRMNLVMKTLTSASIILLVPTLIAGVYGMNFDNMPELHTHYGYFVALGVMAITIIALTTYFKRKEWL